MVGGKASKIGAYEGAYASTGVKQIFDAHPELKETRKMTFKIVKPGELYEIVGYGIGVDADLDPGTKSE